MKSTKGIEIDLNEKSKLFEAIQEHGHLVGHSCNNVAPVTNLYLGRATTRSHSSQWSKKKVVVET